MVATKNGETLGAVTTAVGKRAGLDVGMIMDLVAKGGVPVMRAMLRAAEWELKSRGIGLVTCQSSTPLVREALKQEGYRNAGPALTRKQFHFVYRPTGNSGWPRPPVVLQDWHLTFGDSDNA